MIKPPDHVATPTLVDGLKLSTITCGDEHNIGVLLTMEGKDDIISCCFTAGNEDKRPVLKMGPDGKVIKRKGLQKCKIYAWG